MEKNIESKPCVLISACLIGENVRYDGKIKNKVSYLDELKEKYTLIPVCPEMLGGLGIPRPQSEIKCGQVVNILGKNVTDKFLSGAEKAYKIYKESGAIFAILKESSPSCGSNMIYDGSFSGRKVAGEGITASYLRKMGIKVYSEKNFINR